MISQYYFPEIGAAAHRWTYYSNLLAKMGNDVAVIYGNPELLDVMSNNGIRLIEERYNWETEKKKNLKLYRSLID